MCMYVGNDTSVASSRFSENYKQLSNFFGQWLDTLRIPIKRLPNRRTSDTSYNKMIRKKWLFPSPFLSVTFFKYLEL